MPIRLVLAEDHYLVREGVRSLLDAEPGFEVAAVCGDLDSLLEAVKAHTAGPLKDDAAALAVRRVGAEAAGSSVGGGQEG